MRPEGLRTKIFLDSGDPAQTREIIDLLGFLDGQTTNPTLVAKNPDIGARIARGKKFSPDELLERYCEVVAEISRLVPDGSVSVEVYADQRTSLIQMSRQAEEMFRWIQNAHVKLPILPNGLSVAELMIPRRMRVNMTLCFSQEQAAAVYAATAGASPGAVFISPFVGRLDDRNVRGMDLVANILRMFRMQGDGHVQVLTASVRHLEHLLDAFALGSDIVTAPAHVLREWARRGLPVPALGKIQKLECSPLPVLERIPYEHIDTRRFWWNYMIAHKMTDTGVERFAADWNALLA